MTIKVKEKYRRLRYVFVLSMLILFAGISYWQLFLRTTINCDDAYVAGNIIPIHALVPGLVTKVYVDNSMYVYANQMLVKQERHLAEERLDRSAAALGEAIRLTRSQFAQIQQAEATVVSLRAQRVKIDENLSRYLKAESGGAVSVQKVADTRADIAIIDSEIIAAQANHQKFLALVGKTSVLQHPSVQKFKAEFIESYILYKRSDIFTPIEGYVVNRHVQVGQPLIAGQLLMNIVPLNDLWITANIKETDMQRVQPGERVIINTNIYGNDVTYHGKVLGIEPAGGSTFSLFPPENTTGNYIHIVERVPVRIGLSPSEVKEHPLRLGMSVRVNIYTEKSLQVHPLVSYVTTENSTYSTSIYDGEMKDALSAVQHIMKKN